MELAFQEGIRNGYVWLLPNAVYDRHAKEIKTGRGSVLSLIFNKAFQRAWAPTNVSAQLQPSIPGKPNEKNVHVRLRGALCLCSCQTPLLPSPLPRLHKADCGREVWRSRGEFWGRSEWPGGLPPAADIFTSPQSGRVLTYLSLLATSSELRWQHARQRPVWLWSGTC